MLKNIFGSQTRTKLLVVFLSNPEREFHIRALCRLLNLEINSVRRELLNLEKIGFLEMREGGKKRFFKVNKMFNLYPELKEIILKTGGGEDELTSHLRGLGKIKLASISGVFLKKEGLVDLLLVGQVNQQKFKKLLSLLEKEIGREINYTILSEDDFHYRQICHDRFLIQVFRQPHRILIDKIGIEEK